MKTLYKIAEDIAKDPEDERKLKLVVRSLEYYLRPRINQLWPIIKIKSIGLLKLKTSVYPPAQIEYMRQRMKAKGHKVWDEERKAKLDNFYNNPVKVAE